MASRLSERRKSSCPQVRKVIIRVWWLWPGPSSEKEVKLFIRACYHLCFVSSLSDLMKWSDFFSRSRWAKESIQWIQIIFLRASAIALRSSMGGKPPMFHLSHGGLWKSKRHGNIDNRGHWVEFWSQMWPPRSFGGRLAIGGNMHMDTRVIKVAEFKSEIRCDLRGRHGLQLASMAS